MATIPIEIKVMAAGGTESSSDTNQGSFEIIKIDATAVTGTSCVVTANHVQQIDSVIVMELNSGGNVSTSDIDVTWSGQTITIADGASYDLSATGDNITLFVAGDGNA